MARRKTKEKWIIEGFYKGESTEDVFYGSESQVQAEINRLHTLPHVEITGYKKVETDN